MKISEKIKDKASYIFKEAMNSGIPAAIGLITMFVSIVISQSVVIAFAIIKAISGGWLMALQISAIGGLLSVVVGITMGCLFGWATSCIVHLVNKIKQS